MSFNATITYVIVDCPKDGCHVQFAISADFDKRKRTDHQDFYCPNGHNMAYGGKTRAEKERDQAQLRATRLQAQLDQAESEKRNLTRQRTALKGQLTKSKKRSANGLCPCCNRSFKQLRRHMANKHPEYVEANA
jgi:hypothetical protein